MSFQHLLDTCDRAFVGPEKISHHAVLTSCLPNDRSAGSEDARCVRIFGVNYMMSYITL